MGNGIYEAALVEKVFCGGVVFSVCVGCFWWVFFNYYEIMYMYIDINIYINGAKGDHGAKMFDPAHVLFFLFIYLSTRSFI